MTVTLPPWLKDRTDRWLKAYEFVRFRQRHYRLLFDPKNGNAKAVLRDLAKFCRADASTFGSTVEQTYALNGRREVWLRIMQHLHFEPHQLTDILIGPEQEN